MSADEHNEDSAESETSRPVETTLPAETTELFANGEQVHDPAEHSGLERGANVGRYTVLERIGAGGMGVVYAAFDPTLDRRIALKVMHPGEGGKLGTRGRARLLREAQAMAKLSHPNVITVHDVGTYGERVFVAMEFIEGSTLREWLEDDVREWPEIVHAFVRAGKGLGAAHAAGLVHRDFKPDNVLIGLEGRVLVMDFGLARQATPATGPLDRELAIERPVLPTNADIALTRTGAMMGTPAYMAPEQHRGGAVTASADQFSFCVALYEGLYGERPFAGNSVTSLAMNVLEGNLRAAPRDTKVPAWIRSVVVRGFASESEDRYPSMDALLAELQRDPPQPKRPWTVAAVTVGVAGTITGGYWLSRPPPLDACKDAPTKLAGQWDEGRRTAVQQALASSELPYADTTAKSVTSTLDDYAQRWLSAYAKRCEITRKRSRRASAPQEDMGLLCLDDKRRDLEALARALGNSSDAPQVVENAVQAAQSLAPAEACLDPVSSRRDPRASASENHRARLDQLHVGLAWGRALERTGRHQDALLSGRSQAAQAKTLNAPDLRAEALLLVARAELKLGRPGSAERSLRQTIFAAARAQHDGIAAAAWTANVEVLAFKHALYDAARPVALAAEAATLRAGDDPSLRARLLLSLGWIAQAQWHHDAALDHSIDALQIGRDQFPPTDLRQALAHEAVGAAQEGLGLYAEAIDHHRSALTLREQVLGAQHPLVARSLVRLGSAMLADRRLQAAESNLLRARLLLDPQGAVVLAREDPDAKLPNSTRVPPELAARATDLGLCLDQLGLLRRTQQRHALASRLHRAAAALLEHGLGRTHPALGYPLENLGLSMSDRGRDQDAIPYLRTALAHWRTTLPADHPDLGVAYLNLANALWKTGVHREAGEQFAAALDIWEQSLPKGHPFLAYALTGLGRAHLSRGELVPAIGLLERALELRQHEDEDRLNLAETSLLLAQALWATGRDSNRALELAVAARKTAGADKPEDHASLLSREHPPKFAQQLIPAGLGVNNRLHPL